MPAPTMTTSSDFWACCVQYAGIASAPARIVIAMAMRGIRVAAPIVSIWRLCTRHAGVSNASNAAIMSLRLAGLSAFVGAAGQWLE
jgi:hypothetical protein